MKKILILAFLFLASPLFAQLPQFSSQPTTDTDYTCVGVVSGCTTWPMPAIPGQGSSYTDSGPWNTTMWELTTPGGSSAIPVYSRVQSWSMDNKKFFLEQGNYIVLYDATTTPPTLINTVTTSDGTLIQPYSGDAYWAFTNPTRIYYIPWGSGVYGTAGLQLRYVDISSCAAGVGNCTLTPTIVHTFSCTADSYAPSPITPGTPCNVIETSSGAQGGFSDDTDTYFSFFGDISNGNGRATVDVIHYNRATDTVDTQAKWYTKMCPGGTPSGCYTWSSWNAGYCALSHQGYNMFRMNQHPDARYIAVVTQCAPPTWSRGSDTEAFDNNWNFLGPLGAYNHQDTGFDINGVPVWVGVGGQQGNASEYWSLSVVGFPTLSSSGFTGISIQLPCGFSYTNPSTCGGSLMAAKFGQHVSLTGTWGSTPGYVLMSTLVAAGQSNANQLTLPTATTIAAAISSTGSQTVTPGSMASIAVGTQQTIDCGNGASCNTTTAETVTVTATTGSTFTANFLKTHLAGATVQNLTVGDTGWGALENIAVKIDTTATNNSNALFWRLGRHFSIRDGNYDAEAHTTVNRDWTQFIFGSNWSVDGGTVNAYWTGIPNGSTSHLVTVTAAGTGGGSLTPGSGPYIQGTNYTFTGTPFSGSTGPVWSGTCGATGSSGTVTVTAPTSACTVIGTFTSSGSTVATPTFSPAAGTYGSAQTVTIATSTAGATLCYTTDGSTPTESGNACSGGTTQTYSTPITVSTTQTVKVLGTLSGYTDSAVGSAAYVIGFTLTVTKTGNGASSGSLSGTNCANGTYPTGTAITCTNSGATSGVVFTTWGGACAGMGTCTFSLTSNMAVSGNFVLTTAQELNLDTTTPASTPNTSVPGWNINTVPGDTGGVNAPASVAQTIGNASPAGAPSGVSMLTSETTLATSTQTNSLFWNYGTGCDTCTNFVDDEWIYVTNIAASDNIETDFDQYNLALGRLFSFGHQCHPSGFWQYANNTSGWQNTSVSCSLAGNAWHHIIWTGHRVAGDTSCSGGVACDYYDLLTVDGTTSTINATLPSESLPGGYPSALIKQVQVNAGPTTGSAATVSYNLDEMNFSAYAIGAVSPPLNLSGGVYISGGVQLP